MLEESSKLQWIRAIATCCLLRAVRVARISFLRSHNSHYKNTHTKQVHNSASTERIRVFADSGADLNATDPTDKEHRPALLIALQEEETWKLYIFFFDRLLDHTVC